MGLPIKTIQKLHLAQKAEDAYISATPLLCKQFYVSS